MTNKPYKWENMPHIACGNIDIHARLCYTLLHVKHDSVATLDIPTKALEIIDDAQKPLLDIITDLQQQLNDVEKALDDTTLELMDAHSGIHKIGDGM